ncbi:RadC family protein [Alteromonas oceanisediminis]|uniref:RadC family protein n=1 Tax=Alteromonas oceanisediminis TaxID=2836180 RepID=UPI001BD93EED|nr:DNA repair protein RadC [Alteromonas oceanisediminis]MBT0586743.1 DNA repair protein RadC [Alteromonas oceanisediminis]
MKITDWPKSERPREKLLLTGAESLSDAEILAVFLRTGVQGKSAIDLARDILNQFGDLGQFVSAKKQRMIAQPGIGLAKYAQLVCAMELANRCTEYQLKRQDVFTSVDAAKRYVQQQMRFLTQEVFALLMLDSQHQLIAFRKMFFGTINSAAVYPRELVKQALEDNAAAVILVHNHPSGVAEPSQADIAITEQIRNAMHIIDIRVLDHFVVGGATTVSFAERGLL